MLLIYSLNILNNITLIPIAVGDVIGVASEIIITYMLKTYLSYAKKW